MNTRTKETLARTANLKFNAIKIGDILIPDGGFTCMAADKPKCVEEHDGELFIPCSDGKHFLCGQEDDEGNLVGLSRSPLTGNAAADVSDALRTIAYGLERDPKTENEYPSRAHYLEEKLRTIRELARATLARV